MSGSKRGVVLVVAVLLLSIGVEAQVYNVRNYGAVGDGSTDDTSAVQAAFTAAITGGRSSVYFPPGTYVVKSALPAISTAQISIYGDGSRVSLISFQPTSAAACITFQPLSTYVTYDFARIRGLGMVGSTSAAKTAFKLIAVSASTVDDVWVNFSGNSSDTALELQGWDQTDVGSAYLQAARPIHVAKPTVGTGTSTGSFDHFSFHDITLFGTNDSNPLISIDSGVTMSNVSFTGRQAWVGGDYGIKCVTTGSVNNVVFQNIRWENSGTQTGSVHNYMFDLEPATASARLTFVNCVGGSPGAQGFKLRNLEYISLIDTAFGGTDQSLTEWDADDTCDNISFTNVAFSNSANTSKLWGTSLKAIFAAPTVTTTGTVVYPFAYYQQPSSSGINYDAAFVYGSPVWKTTIASWRPGAQ